MTSNVSQHVCHYVKSDSNMEDLERYQSFQETPNSKEKMIQRWLNINQVLIDRINDYLRVVIDLYMSNLSFIQ